MTKLQNERENVMSEVVKTLIQYGAKKTGYPTKFKGIQDFRIDEVEMLDFLTENCTETNSVLTAMCEKYQKEFNKPSSIDWLLMQTVFTLNKTYTFGWLIHKPVTKLDTITDISQIELKERHINYLNKLCNLYPDIDNLFIQTYNKTHPLLNLYRIDQVFSYIYEVLQTEGIELSYKDFIEACPSGEHMPYFSRENYGYFVVDNYDCYDGKLFICPDNNNELKWTYTASRNGDSWCRDKQRAEDKVKLLEKLNEVASIEGLSWRVEYLNRHDIPDALAKYEKWIDKWNNQSLFIYKEIPKGCKGKHRQALKNIRARV